LGIYFCLVEKGLGLCLAWINGVTSFIILKQIYTGTGSNLKGQRRI